MYLGRIVELAPTDALFPAPRHPYTEALFSAVPVPDPTARRQRIMLERRHAEPARAALRLRVPHALPLRDARPAPTPCRRCATSGPGITRPASATISHCRRSPGEARRAKGRRRPPRSARQEGTMTQIRSLSQPRPRRPGELGVHSLDHFNFAVPDLKQAQKFYADFGLDVREEGNGLGIYTHGQPHRWGRIAEGPAKKLTYLSFGAYAEDFEPLRARLRQFEVEQLDPPAGFETNGMWFRDPDGTLIEIRVAEKSSPNEKSAVSNPSSAARRAGLAFALRGASRAPAAARACAGVLRRCQPRDPLLRRGGRAAALGSLGRRRRVHARHPWQRPPHARLRQIGRARAASSELGRGLDPRDRARRDADGGARASARAGGWAGTCSAPTISTMCATPGAATRNTRRTSTTFPSIATGRAATIPGMTHSTCGGRTRRPISW